MGQIMLNGIAYAGADGGACGCFVDTSNVIKANSAIIDFPYVATQDCAVYVSVSATNAGVFFSVDGEYLYSHNSSASYTYTNTIFIRRGQSLDMAQTGTLSSSNYTVYGVIQGLDSTAQSRYSTSEKAVGVWIDGKTLYQKSFPITVGTTNFDIDISSLNVDKVFFVIEGSYKVSSDGNIVYLGYYASGTDRFSAYYRHSNELIRVGNVGSEYSGTGYITIRYTKANS